MDINGINKGKLIAALYNSSKPAGPFGALNALKDSSGELRDMTEAEGTGFYDRYKSPNGDISFDYVMGHVFKVAFIGDVLERPDLFDRDNGEGACAKAVAAARK